MREKSGYIYNWLHHKNLQGTTHIEQTRDLLPSAGARAASRPLFIFYYTIIQMTINRTQLQEIRFTAIVGQLQNPLFIPQCCYWYDSILDNNLTVHVLFRTSYHSKGRSWNFLSMILLLIWCYWIGLILLNTSYHSNICLFCVSTIDCM